MIPDKIYDKYGNELQCGDNVCYAESGSSWRQTPRLMRASVAALITTKAGNFVILKKTDGTKILASSVVKCY